MNYKCKSRFNCVTRQIKGVTLITLYYSTIQNWNILPESIKYTTDLQMIRKEVKFHLKCSTEEDMSFQINIIYFK